MSRDSSELSISDETDAFKAGKVEEDVCQLLQRVIRHCHGRRIGNGDG